MSTVAWISLVVWIPAGVLGYDGRLRRVDDDFGRAFAIFKP